MLSIIIVDAILLFFTSCRPSQMQFFVGVIAPFTAIYIVNWLIYLVIMAVLIRRHLQARKEPHNQKPQLKQQFRSAFVLSILFGLGWGFGLPITGGVDDVVLRTTFQILFIFATSFQGLFVFIMNCLTGRKSVDCQREWKNWFRLVTCQATGNNGALTKNTTSQAQYRSKEGKRQKYGKSTDGNDTETSYDHEAAFKELAKWNLQGMLEQERDGDETGDEVTISEISELGLRIYHNPAYESENNN